MNADVFIGKALNDGMIRRKHDTPGKYVKASPLGREAPVSHTSCAWCVRGCSSFPHLCSLTMKRRESLNYSEDESK